MLNETIDVLIPVYNCEKYLSLCLDSLISQTYKNLRIVLVDDGSTDASIEILKQYSKKYSNIEFYQKQNEASISKTRNFLLEKIKSKYFSFFDSDDYAKPTYFETLINNLKNYNADVSICGKIRHKENKKVSFKKFNQKHNEIILFNKQECLAEMLSSNLFNGTVYSKLFKSELLLNSKFDPKIHYGEDLDFCFKIMQNANKFVFTKKKLYHYIIRKNSIVTSKFNEKKLTCINCYDNIINKIQDNAELLTAAKSMQGLIAIELLYYTWRDKYKNKQIKSNLKNIIKHSIPFIKKNKRLSKLYRCTPAVWWLTKFM
ncbi:MAG: glycosyltransferase [Clostridia bacterium]|nr:glycosyltransferase [Clostridia bacterium]